MSTDYHPNLDGPAEPIGLRIDGNGVCQGCGWPSTSCVCDDEDRGRCDRCGGDGFIEYNDGDGGDWGEDCPSEENHLITCRACRGTGRTT